jgi:nucleoid DNA-binding protein
MEKHILNLLNTNLRVIIPDFGAFIIRQKEPLVLVFNEFLRYNDGLLIDFVAKTENIEKEMARHQVNEFKDNLIKILETGREVKLSGIGTLRKSGADKIEFVQAGREAPRKPAKKAEDKAAEANAAEISVPLEITEDAAKADIPPEAGVKSEITGESGKVMEKSIEKPIEKLPEDKPKTNGTGKRPATPTEPASRPKTMERPVPRPPVVKPPVKGNNEKNKQQQLIWIVLIIIVIALINGWFIFNDEIRGFLHIGKKASTYADTLGQMLTTDTLGQSLTMDSAAAFQELNEEDFTEGEETIEKMPVEPASGKVTAGLNRFYIVAGCFREEANADAMVKKLNQQGYKAEKFGTVGNLFAVSYASFPTKEQALQELERIRKEVDAEAWLRYY